jgi:hypothetical protein
MGLVRCHFRFARSVRIKTSNSLWEAGIGCIALSVVVALGADGGGIKDRTLFKNVTDLVSFFFSLHIRLCH